MKVGVLSDIHANLVALETVLADMGSVDGLWVCGDTVGYVEGRKLVKSFGHVSTGGGASLELMGGRTLPGVEALENKK